MAYSIDIKKRVVAYKQEGHTFVQLREKFEIHLPYSWQETQFEQIGVVISRQDMSNWQQQAFKKLSPLFELLKTNTIERELRDKNIGDEQFVSEWKSTAGPVLEGFKAWLEKRKDEVPAGMLLGKAIQYSLSHVIHPACYFPL